MLPREGLLVRMFIGEQDMADGIPLYEAVVLRARKKGIAGATVLRGIMGYGASSRIHTTKILRLSEDMPMIIELVDSEEKINNFLPELEDLVQGGLITLERIRIQTYSTGTPPEKSD